MPRCTRPKCQSRGTTCHCPNPWNEFRSKLASERRNNKMPPLSLEEISIAYKKLMDSGELAPDASSRPCKHNAEKLCDWLDARTGLATKKAPQTISRSTTAKTPEKTFAPGKCKKPLVDERVKMLSVPDPVAPVLEYYAFPPVEDGAEQTKFYDITTSKTLSGDPSIPFLAPDPLVIKSMKGGRISSLTAHVKMLQRLRMPEFMRFAKGIDEGNHPAYKNAKTISAADVVDVLESVVKQRTGYMKTSAPHDFLEYKDHNPGCKYVVCGDLHGGIHAILRHLQRWYLAGIIDDKWVVKSGFTIVFLGDLLDRGGYSFEVATTVLWLYSQNHKNQRVWLCRGNHEEHGYRDRKPGFGCGDERLVGINEEQSRMLTERVKDVFRFFPSAIVLKACGKNVILVHGGICDTLHLKDHPHKFRLHGEFQNIRLLNPYPAYALRWNDFRTQDKSLRNKRRPEQEAIFKKTGMTDARKYMKEENVSVILRGHQDHLNFQLMLRHPQAEEAGNDLFNVFMHEECMQFLHETFGSNVKTRHRPNDRHRFTASFFLNESQRPDHFLPIFTTSSARIRPFISADCFVVLRFDLSKRGWEKDDGGFATSMHFN